MGSKRKFKHIPVTNIHLKTWNGLNAYLMSATFEDVPVLERLVLVEYDGRARKQFISRIYSRIARLRRAKEVKTLKEQLQKKEDEKNEESSNNNNRL